MTETTTFVHPAAFDFGDQPGRGATRAESDQARRGPTVGRRAMPHGGGIALAVILGFLLWLLIILVSASLVSAL